VCNTSGEQVKYLNVLLYASLKDDNDIQSEEKTLSCIANNFKGTFAQCSSAVKTPFCA